MTLRSIFKRYLPKQHEIADHHYFRHFGSALKNPNLWHLTRRSSAGGVATGLFCAFIPIPVQMLIAALLAILFRVNLPLAVIFAWVTNPVTFAPIFIFSYKLGTWLLDEPVRQVAFELTLEWFTDKLIHIWEPLLLGSMILGSLSALAGYIAIRLIWRMALVRKWDERRRRRQKLRNTDE